jgi:hypothetical protein
MNAPEPLPLRDFESHDLDDGIARPGVTVEKRATRAKATRHA